MIRILAGIFSVLFFSAINFPANAGWKLYDDFSSGFLNTQLWSISGSESGQINIEDGRMKLVFFPGNNGNYLSAELIKNISDTSGLKFTLDIQEATGSIRVYGQSDLGWYDSKGIQASIGLWNMREKNTESPLELWIYNLNYLGGQREERILDGSYNKYTSVTNIKYDCSFSYQDNIISSSVSNLGSISFELPKTIYKNLIKPNIGIQSFSSDGSCTAYIDDVYVLNNNLSISGVTYFDGKPVSCMVLANGEYCFSGSDGKFTLCNVPLNSSGQVKIFSFCDGLAPFEENLNPTADNLIKNIYMQKSSGDEAIIDVAYTIDTISSGQVHITGSLSSNEIPVCALVLANGQYQFTSPDNGKFSLNVPVDSQGQIVLFSFASGFSPKKIIIDARTGYLSAKFDS